MKVKLFFVWLLYGLFFHVSFSKYVFIKTFVGPPRKTAYQEAMEMIDRMKLRMQELNDANR